MERPIFHHLQDRTQTHIFLCVLPYHLLAAILQAGMKSLEVGLEATAGHDS